MARANELVKQTPPTTYRKAWTTTPANYNIAANDPTGAERACVRITVGDVGTTGLVVTDLSGENVTFTSDELTAQLGRLDIQAAALVASGSDADHVVVYWA